MKKVLFLLALLLSLAAPAWAQQGNTTIIRFTGAPTGNCAPFSLGINSATGALYDCVAGVWTLVGTPGGGALPGSPTGSIQYNAGASTFGGSSQLLAIQTNCDNLGTACITKYTGDNSGGYIRVITNSNLSADHYWAENMNSVNGNYTLYGTVDNMAFSGFTINLATDTMLLDDGSGSAMFIKAPRYDTLTNCSDSAGDAACGAAPEGAVVVDAADTTTVVSTTAVTANSNITVQYAPYLSTRLSVTCNATAVLPTVTAISAGVSFTITVAAAPTINPACFVFRVTN